MNVLFVTVAWPNEGDRNLYSDLMHEFQNDGHTVYVVHADEKEVEIRLQVENGIHVLRVSTRQIRKAGKFKKMISLATLGYRLKKSINEYLSGVDIDLIISHSPPITLSGLMRYLKKKYQASFYYLLKDIWPHSSVDLNIIKKNGLIYKYFRWHEKRIYRTADVIGCMSPKNVEYILRNNSYLSSEKVEECPNSITPKELPSANRKQIRAKYEIPQEATVFIFSGNLSKGHGLEFYINSIEELNNYEKAYFLIGGSGTQYKFLKETLDKRQLKNVFLYEWLPKDDFLEVLLASDVGMILLSSDYTVPQFPSRLLAYLEASKPVLCAVNEETDIGSIVEEAKCGISVRHGDKNAFLREIKRLSENNRYRRELAKNSKNLLYQRYTCKDSYSTIMSHLTDKHYENCSISE